MTNKKEVLLNVFPKHQDIFKQQLREDKEYAAMWLDSILQDYTDTKDVNELVYNLKPLIEANYTVCEFAKLIGIHRITLYKIFSRKMVPSIEILHKIFSGLGYELKLSVNKL